MVVVLDEAEAAGRLLEAVEAHDQAFDFAAFGEELVDLFFGCVEGSLVASMRMLVAAICVLGFTWDMAR